MIQIIDLNFQISGTKIFLPFQAICSVTDKVFMGDIVIEYNPTDKALEYVDAEKVVTGFTQVKLTAEELTYKVFTEVKDSIKPKYLKVLIDVKKSEAHQPVQVWLEE